MSIMRMRLKLRGIVLRDSSTSLGSIIIAPRYIFNFANVDYYKILFDTGFSLDAAYTTDDEEIWVGGEFTAATETLITTERFIYPLILKPIAVIDGTVKGSTKIGLKKFTDTDDGYVILSKLIVSLIKIDQDANETVLGTVTQTFFIDPVWTINTDSTTIVWHAFPYFFDVKNEKINFNDRLILEIKPYGFTINLTEDHARFYMAAAVEADNQYIDVPIV